MDKIRDWRVLAFMKDADLRLWGYMNFLLQNQELG